LIVPHGGLPARKIRRRADSVNDRFQLAEVAMRRNWLQRQVTKTITRRPLWRPRLERLEDKLAPAVFTVTNTNDFGLGSLWHAIADANATGGPDAIPFAIP